MSRVRHTNMKIWDFSWQCYNITSPRDTWPGLGTLRGRGVWSRRCGSFPTRAPLSHEAQQPLYSRGTHQHWRERTQMQCMLLPSGVRVLVWVWVLWSRLFFPVTKSWQAPSETLSGWSQTRGDTWHGHDTSVTWRGDTWHVTRPCTLPLTSQAETIPFFKYPEILDKLILKTFESLDPRPRGY